MNATGMSEISVSRTEGHHGNPITILETTVVNAEMIDKFFSGLDNHDLNQLLSSLSSRIDDHCNLFVKLDKQSAFNGERSLGRNDDVISIRIHVRSFPSRCDVAASVAEKYLEDVLRKKNTR